MLTSTSNEPYIHVPESGSFIDILDYQSNVHPNKPILKYFDKEPITITFLQFNNLVNEASHFLKDNIKSIPKLNEEGYAPISYLADSSQNYPVNLLALLKLNLTPVVLSPKNSIDILVNLIKESGSRSLIYDENNKEQAIQCKEKLAWLEIIDEIQISNIKENNNKVIPLVDLQPKTKNFEDNIFLILHSSGSTSTPKLIKIPNRFNFSWSKVVYNEINPINLFGNGLLIVPFYHGFGLAVFLTSLLSGSCLTIPVPNNLSPSQIFNDIKCFNCTLIILTPYVLKELIDYCSKNKHYWKLLSNLKCIFTAGALLPKELNKESIQNGVNIINGYGLTEAGHIATNVKHKGEDDIDYLKFAKDVKYKMVNVKGDTCQLVINKNYWGLAAGVVKDDEEGLLLGDIFRIIEYDPTRNHLIFQILGRQDDTIIHISGEKTNPLPIEAEIMSNPFIKNCLIYGTGKLFNCVIIELNKDAITIPVLDLEKSIVNQIEKANVISPKHSRIFPELVHVLPFDSKKSFITTAKGNMIRKKNEELFKEEINDLYLNFNIVNIKGLGLNDGDLTQNEDKFRNLTKELLELFFKSTGKNINEDQIFFLNGMDSLSVVRFKNLILSKYPNDKLTINDIYENNSIKSLYDFIVNNGNKRQKFVKNLKEHQDEVDKLIEHYTTSLNDEQAAVKEKKAKDLIVLITGANGSLGCFIIKALLQRKEIRHIYALSRAKTSEESLMRLKKGFEDRLINLNNEEWSKITALPYKMDDSKLGLDAVTYDKIFNCIDIIYHVAWKMDFLKGVNLFKDCIEGTINLLKISALSPTKPAFHFTSTVGASIPVSTSNTLLEQPLTTKLSNISGCNGYNLSKLVCEAIAQKWSQHYNFELDIHRVGQVSGDTINGAWNIREYMPLLIKGIQVMKVAPKNFMDISWIPVDYAANGMVEIHFSNHNQHNSTINHITNPNVFPFSVVLDSLKNYGLEFKIVDNEEFIHLLTTKKEYQDVDINPMASLTDFFANTLKDEVDKFNMETKETKLRAISIHTCPVVNNEFIFKYLEFWKAIKFLN